VGRLEAMRDRMRKALAAVGYKDVEIDARGYRLGSLNERAANESESPRAPV
jgi:PP-loop superfamily ATP-utilizing enzyme